MSSAAGTLGIIQLANRPLDWLGALGNPATFGYPVRYRTAREAFAERVARADPTLAQSYVDAAHALEKEGVVAIITTCGFAIAYQQALSAAVRVPVATSSLLLLPLLAQQVSHDRAIGVLTFDARRLNAAFLERAGLGPWLGRTVIAGIEGTRSWQELSAAVPDLTPELLWADLEPVLASLMRGERQLGAILLECSGFGALADHVRKLTRLPTYDFVSLSDMLMAAL